jgi:hypothetical protein
VTGGELIKRKKGRPANAQRHVMTGQQKGKEIQAGRYGQREILIQKKIEDRPYFKKIHDHE